MQARLPLVLALLVSQTGCHSYAYRLPKSPPALPAPAPALPAAQPAPTGDPYADTAPHGNAQKNGGGGICEIDPSACPSAADLARHPAVHADVYAVQQTYPAEASFMSAGSLQAPVASQLPEAAPEAARHEMLDVQARFSIECESVAVTASKLRETVRLHGGAITLDESTSGGRDAEATFEVRVVLGGLDTLVASLSTLGTIDAREVKVKDIAKEHHDAQLLLHNLEEASKRYEQLLDKATGVPEVLTIERELERLRSRIDRVKGDLAWMKDRVARATVRVRLHPSGTSTAEEPPLASKSSFFPGVRAVSLLDFRGESDRYAYLGGGLAFAFHGRDGPRAIVFELDMARTALTDRPPNSNYAYLGLGGADLYSDLLGGGRRRFLNPYLGFRGGYAQSQGHGDLALGGVLGLDIVKSNAAVLELALRGLVLVGSDRGAHIAVGPTLAVDFAF